MDLDSITLGAGSADFGPGGVVRHMSRVEFHLVYEPDSGVVMAMHRQSRQVRFIWPASGVVAAPSVDSFPAAFRPKDPPPAKPLNGANGRGATPRPTR
jgi:hypothetical protein